MRAAEIPAAWPAARYQAMIDKSPFSLATPPPAVTAAPEPAGPTFYQDLYVVGIAKIGGKNFVSIASRDQSQHFSVTVGETGPEGIVVDSVISGTGIGTSKVKVKKDGKEGLIGFDDTIQNNASPNGATPPQQMPPGMPGVPPGMQPPMLRPPVRNNFAPAGMPNRPMTVPNVKAFRPGQPMVPPGFGPQGRIRQRPIPNPRQ